MSSDMNLYRDLVSDISPFEFEVFCCETLKAYAQEEGLPNFKISHNQQVETFDGKYQIDILGEYTALGVHNTVVVECKMYSRAIERKVVSELYSKVQSIGANKGIIMSTAGYQSGAVQYAQAHGISLLQIVDRSIKHIVGTAVPCDDYQWLEYQLDRYLPKYFAMKWNLDYDFPLDEVYPTKEMERAAMDNVRNTMLNNINNSFEEDSNV